MKACTKCKVQKEADNFYKIKGGKSLHSKCKSCCSEINKENQKKRNKIKKKEYNELYYQKNKQVISEQNREGKNAYQRNYYQLNKNFIFEKEKEKYHTDVRFRLAKIYRNRMNSYIKGETEKIKYLNCSVSLFKKYIQSQLLENNTYEIDHVLPVSKFDLTNKEHVRVCFHWCNLRAICPQENKKKSNKIIEDCLMKQRNSTYKFAKENQLEHLDIYDFYKSNKQYFS